jgi:hypothetical protein
MPDHRRIVDFLAAFSDEFCGPDGVRRPVAELDKLKVLHEGITGYDLMLVITRVGRYLFDMKRFSVADILLLETPDVIAGKYKRNGKVFYLFAINSNGGAWVSKNVHDDDSHSRLFVEIRDGMEPSFGSTGGVNANMSGVILPKQDGVPENWVSYWDKRGYDAGLTARLLNYCGCTGPYKVEYNAGGIIGEPVIVD